MVENNGMFIDENKNLLKEETQEMLVFVIVLYFLYTYGEVRRTRPINDCSLRDRSFFIRRG